MTEWGKYIKVKNHYNAQGKSRWDLMEEFGVDLCRLTNQCEVVKKDERLPGNDYSNLITTIDGVNYNLRMHTFMWLYEHKHIIEAAQCSDKDPLTQDKVILHADICMQNRRCVKPDHLRLGTQKENMTDRRRVNQNTRMRHLTDNEIAYILTDYNLMKMKSYQELADKYKLSVMDIYSIVIGRTDKNVLPELPRFPDAEEPTKMDALVPLPIKPSELINLTISSGNAIDRKVYVPHYAEITNTFCLPCMVLSTESLDASKYINQLIAINDFRYGDLHGGLMRMGVYYYDLTPTQDRMVSKLCWVGTIGSIEHRSWEDHDRFATQFSKLAEELEEVGL